MSRSGYVVASLGVVGMLIALAVVATFSAIQPSVRYSSALVFGLFSLQVLLIGRRRIIRSRGGG